MASKSQPTAMASTTKKTTDKPTSKSTEEEQPAEETFLPLAARDSMWVGVNFFNPHFRDEEEKDENEVYDVKEQKSAPFFQLFPNLKEKYSKDMFTAQSTINITRMLVGQKPNFDITKNHKVFYTRASLPALKEEELVDDLEEINSKM